MTKKSDTKFIAAAIVAASAISGAVLPAFAQNSRADVGSIRGYEIRAEIGSIENVRARENIREAAANLRFERQHLNNSIELFKQIGFKTEDLSESDRRILINFGKYLAQRNIDREALVSETVSEKNSNNHTENNFDRSSSAVTKYESGVFYDKGYRSESSTGSSAGEDKGFEKSGFSIFADLLDREREHYFPGQPLVTPELLGEIESRLAMNEVERDRFLMERKNEFLVRANLTEEMIPRLQGAVLSRRL